MIGSGYVMTASLGPRPLCCIKRYIFPSVGRFAEDNKIFIRINASSSSLRRRRFHSSSPNCHNHHHDDSSAPSQSQQSGLLASFAHDWNTTLSHHPQTVLASFLSVQATTWLGLYASLSAVSGGVVILPPSLAAGWAVSKFSKKFRQPMNVALAAIMVKVFPMLGEVKVTPLVTGLVMGDNDKKIISKQVEEKAPSAMPIIKKVAKGAKWLEGPVDKYGLSYYLSSRITGVSTLCISAYLVHQGMDVGMCINEALSSWGGTGQELASLEGLGEAAGTAAAASVLNVFFVPVHFYSSIYGIRALEGTFHAMAKGIVDGKMEAEKDFRRDYYQQQLNNNDEENKEYNNGTRQEWNNGDRNTNEESEQNHQDSEYERIANGAMRSLTLLLLAYSLIVSLYSFRLLKETATVSKSKDDRDSHNDDQQEILKTT